LSEAAPTMATRYKLPRGLVAWGTEMAGFEEELMT
jgi:hypothetical protein